MLTFEGLIFHACLLWNVFFFDFMTKTVCLKWACTISTLYVVFQDLPYTTVRPWSYASMLNPLVKAQSTEVKSEILCAVLDTPAAMGYFICQTTIMVLTVIILNNKYGLNNNTCSLRSMECSSDGRNAGSDRGVKPAFRSDVDVVLINNKHAFPIYFLAS